MLLTFRAALYPVKQESDALAAEDGEGEVVKYTPQVEEDAGVRRSQDENDLQLKEEAEVASADDPVPVQIY